MKLSRRVVLISSLIISVVLICAGTYCYIQFRNCNCQFTGRGKLLAATFEIEPRFLITNTNQIFLSGHDNGNYSIYSYARSKNILLSARDSDIFFPFLFKKELCGLIDHNGNEQFTTTNYKLNKILGYRSIKELFSVKNGELLFIKLKADKKLYAVDANFGTMHPVLDSVDHLESVLYKEDVNSIIVNHDHKLQLINLSNLERQPQDLIAESNSDNDGKFNPFLVGDDLYFASNKHSDFYEIFKINLRDTSHKISLIYRGIGDVRLPKVKNNKLYFIEINNGEYLLKNYDLKTKLVTSITSHGVVYFYEFYKSNSIVFSYADFHTPKSLLLFNELNCKTQNLTGMQLSSQLSIQPIKPVSDLSAAYILKVPLEKYKGVILFFRPGLHGDFSPRWEPILMNLVDMGYIIIAPNYPMSSGYGKAFYSKPMVNGLKDISKWKAYIKLNYPNMKLYYLSSSSGNLLMENTLAVDYKDIAATCSIFGVPAFDSPDPKVPSLYLLGKNDPIINFKSRFRNLQIARNDNDNIVVQTYNDEGHWLRKNKNMENCSKVIAGYFCEH